MAAAENAGKPAPPLRKLRAIGGNATDEAVAPVTIFLEVSGLVGRVLLAFAAVRIASRRSLLRLFQWPALLVVAALFWWISTQLTTAESLPWIKAGIVVAGLLTVAQFSFWGNSSRLSSPRTSAARGSASPPTSAAA